MLSVKDLSYSIGSRTLLDDVSVVFLPGNRYAVSGPNGAGKSTFLKMINGTISDYTGLIGKNGSISTFEQNLTPEQMDSSVLNFIMQGHASLWQAMSSRDRLYSLPFTDEVGIEMATVEEKIIELDGYSIEPKIEKHLVDVGVSLEVMDKKMIEISNADRMKCALIRAIISNPDMLLLDEPTNGIDIFALEWLKNFLTNSYRGLLIFVSHDVDFINDVSTHIADIDYENITIYPGSYYDMVATKKGSRESLERENVNIKKQKDKMQSFISRFGSGTRASQAKSRQKQLEKMKNVDIKKSNVVAPYLAFDFGEPSVNNVIELQDISKSNDHGEEIIKGFSLRIDKGEKIAVLGKNGCGKSLFMKILSGTVEPDFGTVKLGGRVKVGYFPQNHSEAFKDEDEDLSILNWVGRGLAFPEEKIRAVLGRMLFTADDAFKKIKVLSGGETVRCLFARLILSGANLIILDDPCSHLDIGSVLSLKKSIEACQDKTFIIATNSSLHDICDKLLIFEEKNNNAIHTHLGMFEDYMSKENPKNN
ncbi:MAG: ABC-F family ATP-binding cassette domain-containing protein [Chlamydiia bacterium]|nr:ABC-F family ATP-binding cassette domain-containing protein [Chlamydiia bacterium]